jgi:F-type H+-transporting ATPase subunit epsilon
MSASEGPKRLRVELVTPDGPVFVEDARMVVVPGKAGELGVLPRHIPLIAQLKPGETRIRTLDDQWLSYATGAGYFKIQHDRASVLVESAVSVTSIDAERARRDLADAQSRLAEATGEDAAVERARAERDIADAENRLKVSGRA